MLASMPVTDRGSSMAENSVETRAVREAAAPRERLPPAAPASPAPLSPTPASPVASPFDWLNAAAAEAFRAWTRLPGMGPGAALSAAGKTSPAPRWSSATPREEIDEPNSFDRLLHAALGRFSLGISPAGMALAYFDWALHLLSSPGKTRAAPREGAAQGDPPRQLRLAARRRPRLPALHPALAAGPSLCRRGLAPLAVQPDLSGLPAQSAMVAQRDHRHRRRVAASRADGLLRFAPMARHGFAGQFRRGQPRRARDDLARERPKSRARRDQLRRGLGARHGRQAADRRRSLRAGREHRRHQGRGDPSQPVDGAHPIRAGDRTGPCRAGADRAGLDHEVLHSRSFAGEFAGEVSRRARPHRVHDLLA